MATYKLAVVAFHLPVRLALIQQPKSKTADECEEIIADAKAEYVNTLKGFVLLSSSRAVLSLSNVE